MKPVVHPAPNGTHHFCFLWYCSTICRSQDWDRYIFIQIMWVEVSIG